MKYLISILPLFFASCSNNEIIYETKCLENHQKAVLALAPAEFTVGDTYYVSILGENDDIDGNDWAKVFIINNWDNVLPRDTSLVKIKWLNKETLKIAYNSKLRIYSQVIKTRDNLIQYEMIPTSDSSSKSSR